MSGAITTSPSSGSGSKNWYAELAPSEKRTFWACFGGWALDAYDVQIFSFAIRRSLQPSRFPMPMPGSSARSLCSPLR